MKDQKQVELWKRYEELYYSKRNRTETNEKWLNFEKRYYSYLVELSNGGICKIEKSKIETRFCFGYGMYLRATEEELDNAENNAEYARTNEKYFIEENLKSINGKIDMLDDDRYIALLFKDCEGFYYLHHYKAYEKKQMLAYGGYIEPTQEDLNRYKEMLLREKQDFEKRLQTYLKKYGLSKLSVWTYLVD